MKSNLAVDESKREHRVVDSQFESVARTDDHRLIENQFGDVVGSIIELYRRRVDLQRAEIKLTLQIKAICRRLLMATGKKYDEATEESAVLYDCLRGHGEHALASSAFVHTAPLIAARVPLIEHRKIIEKQLASMAKELPIWEWSVGIRGLAALTLSSLVAEIGNPSGYSSVAKVWKRMGVAVMDGTRQGGLGKLASADEWIRHGYVKRRRSVLWGIGASLLRSQKATNGPFYEVYVTRKDYERSQHPEFSKIQVHRRAQRYMEKRFLREMWKAWRLSTTNEDRAK